MRAVILQPMYLPWMGYFGMIDTADVFVFYDDVQFVRRSWQRRNKIKNPNGEFIWLTVPVQKDHGQLITEVEINTDERWRADHWKSIEHTYGNAPFFDRYRDRFADLYDVSWDALCPMNIRFIEEISESLGVDGTEFVRSSTLDVSGSKTDRLIDVLESVDADEYVSGPGAKEYIDVQQFTDAGIDLYWHEFDHPEYEQVHDGFESHLSTLDLLFNVGPEATDLLREAEATALVAGN